MRPAPVDTLVPVLPVPGTHGFSGKPIGDWWHGASPFLSYLDTQGFYTLSHSRPFVWSTGLNGQRFWRRWFGAADSHRDWIAGGLALYAYLRPIFDEGDSYVPIAQRNLIAHSHGLQVVLYACQFGLRINALVSVMSPVRADMLKIALAGRERIGYWEHIATDRSDRWQWFGAIGDGKVGIDREHPLADRNTRVPKMGHSGLLVNPANFPIWAETGILARVRQRSLPPPD